MNSKEIRQKYLNFFNSKKHSIIPSASVIPENDPTTLFTSSGMQPLVPYLLGEKHPEGTRLVNSQKSFRTEDIEEVGDNRHNTFFEMLGNWSLGDYFKNEQLSWYFEFITRELNLNPERLYVTVFRGNQDIGIDRDSEAVEIWKKLFKDAGIEAKDIDFAERDGMQDGRIFYYDEKKNWWSRSGIPANMPVGEPGGPDSEMFYDLGADLKRHENSEWALQPCHVNCDCGRFIEIGNSVFMEFQRTEQGFEKLAQQNVDFGGGLERTVMVVQGLDNIFETDLFINVIKKLESLSGKKYRENMKSFEIVTDHLKAATFIMGDDKGIAPANTGQGYIVRRLVRRAIRYGEQLGITERLWTKEVARVIAIDYGDVYPELKRNIDFVINRLIEEEDKFAKTLEKGLRILNSQMNGQAKKQDEQADTSQLSEDNLDIIDENDITGEKLFNIFQTYGFPLEMSLEELKKQYQAIDDKNIVEIKKQFKEAMLKHQELSRTTSSGMFKGGLADSSEETKKLHTAAHLLLASLRKVLGEHVFQKGSNITAERLRFDFSHAEKMTEDQIREVERMVNEMITACLPVSYEEVSLDEAKTQNAMGVFESKYGEKVKVYKINSEDLIFSLEICGGPHVKNTNELGNFKIIKEESSSAGVRRIKAILS